jgi:polyhydroxyalkanoate synthase
VDKTRFKVGENLATLPGSVVFKNEVLELIQYRSAADKVYKRPLLLVPPQINKFYGMDLTPDKSLLKHCTDNGIQLFVISWRNPGPEHGDWGLAEYIESVKEGIKAIRSITRSRDLNLIAFCSGGVTASALAAHLDAQGDRSIHAMTIGVCVLELQPEDSDISAFAGQAAIDLAKKRSRKAGVLRGKDLARVFNWMRPNDLIWNYVVNNYLMGNDPPAFDILYWNNDTTNLPAGLHADYVDIFSSGAMTRPGEFSVANTPIDLSRLNCDKFFLAGVTDHITPWKACYRDARAFGGDNQFVLSHSGHVQSLINPPGNPKASYYVNDDWPDTADEWQAGAEQQQGSWWPLWMDWLQEHSGELKARPRKLGNSKFKAGAAAPGEYVHEQAG